jgi:hypothetical protein
MGYKLIRYSVKDTGLEENRAGGKSVRDAG